MFDALRNRIHVKMLSLRKKKVQPTVKPGAFVNPFAPKEKTRGRISPYSTDYGEKKPKSIGELLLEKFPKKVVVEKAAVQEEPSIIHGMKIFFSKDILFLASKMGVPKRREKSMSADEIRKACEGVKW